MEACTRIPPLTVRPDAAATVLLASMLAGCAGLPLADPDPSPVSSPSPARRSVDGRTADWRPHRTAGRSPVSTASHQVQSADADGKLSLKTVQRLALEHNPTLLQAQMLAERALGNLRHAHGYPNPRAGFVAGELAADGSRGQQGGFIQQRFPWPAKRRFAQQAAGAAIDRAESLVELQQRRVLTDVELGWIDLLGLDASIKITDDQKRLAASTLELTQRLHKLKEVDQLDVHQAQMELGVTEIASVGFEQRRIAAWKRLACLVGRPDMPAWPLQGQITRPVPPVDWDAFPATVVASHPQLAAARQEVARRTAMLRRAEVDRYPDFTLFVAVQRDQEHRDAITSVQLGAPLPVLYRNQGRIDAAVAERQRARHELQRLRLRLLRRLSAHRAALEAARKELAIRDELQKTAVKNRDLAMKGYELSEFDFIRVLTARRSLLETSLARIEALVRLQNSWVQLQSLVTGGALDPVVE